MKLENREKARELFAQAVIDLEKAQTAILHASSYREITKAERHARQALQNLQFRTMFLEYWIKDTVTEARQNLDSAPLFEDDLHDAPIPKTTRKSKTKKKSK